jgi:hypothetical protein
MKNVEYDKIYGIIEPFMNVDYMVYQLKYDSVPQLHKAALPLPPCRTCATTSPQTQRGYTAFVHTKISHVIAASNIHVGTMSFGDRPPYQYSLLFIFTSAGRSSRDGHQERQARFVAHIMKPKAGYGYPATTAHFAAESSTGTNVNVCTTDDFTKSVDAILTLSQM